MSRDVMINIGCTVFTLGYIALCLIVGILASRQDTRQPPQPKTSQLSSTPNTTSYTRRGCGCYSTIRKRHMMTSGRDMMRISSETS